MRTGPDPRFIVPFGIAAALAVQGAAADAPANSDTIPSAERFVTFDYTGYFRWRSDLFYRGDLGASVGGIRAPLDSTAKNAGKTDASDVLAGTNIRFRFEPTVSVGQAFRIHAQFDVLDNVVLGSSADYHPDRADVHLAALAEGQGAVSDGIAVKQAWLEWEVFHGITFAAGRMSEQFGLGMVTSGGEGLDSDFQDSTDRVSLQIRAFGLHSLWFFDSPFEGATSKNRLDGFGQASDLGSVDDTIRWGFTIGMRPQDAVELEQQAKDLAAGKPSFQWVIKNSFTSQDFQSVTQTDPVDCPADSLGFAYDCVELFPRAASLWTPDVWLRLDWRPAFDTSVRVELELAGLVGSFEYVQNIPDPESKKDMLAFGGVLQAAVTHRALTYGLEFGAASGDDIAFGPYGESFVPTDDSVYAQSDRLRSNGTITRFLFNRDYRVDLLLYREVLGAVTDSFYVKPSVKLMIIDTDTMRLGGTLSMLYAQAFLAEPTPGRDNPLGLETDLNFFYEEPARFRADLDAGFLVPFAGLDNAGLGRSGKTAFTIQARLGILF
jgi:uncharacterized protein (TIGR04551 family)